MCVYSMVVDDWANKLPNSWTTITTPDPDWLKRFNPGFKPVDLIGEIGKMEIELAEAKKQDAVEGNPDCSDPEKQKLLERVKQLEEMLKKQPEFVIVKGGTILESGMYRVIDGKLFKMID